VARFLSVIWVLAYCCCYRYADDFEGAPDCNVLDDVVLSPWTPGMNGDGKGGDPIGGDLLRAYERLSPADRVILEKPGSVRLVFELLRYRGGRKVRTPQMLAFTYWFRPCRAGPTLSATANGRPLCVGFEWRWTSNSASIGPRVGR
jgi:hypothetical protein